MRHRNSRLLSDASCSVLHWAVTPASTTSADFCQSIPTPCDAGSTRQIDRPPRVMRVTFLPYTRRIYSPTLPDDYRALKMLAFSPGWDCLVCDSCSSGRDFACGFLQIPPRDGHPCRSASGSRHQGPQGTCTPKSTIDHHDQSSGACAPRAMPGEQAKKDRKCGPFSCAATLGRSLSFINPYYWVLTGGSWGSR